MSRVLVWFSCGEASAAAAKLAVEKYGNRCEVLYCDTFAYEHPDNRRFFDDIQKWLGREIHVLRNPAYTDIFDVFRKTRWIVGPAGARCTTELKKNLRTAYQRVDDVHVFGFTADERHRVKRFRQVNPELFTDFVLLDQGLTKADCRRMVKDAGIDTPVMYQLGYSNNNCIGCVKASSHGYWNKIRVDFPDAFDRMAKMEREIGAAICKTEGVTDGKRWRKTVYLDELDPESGRLDPQPDMECGVLCGMEDWKTVA